MDENQELTPQQFAEKVNPAKSTSVEWIGKNLAFVAKGISLTLDSQYLLYGKHFVGSAPTFDYIDLATDELESGSPDSRIGLAKDQRETAERYKERNPGKEPSVQFVEANVEALKDIKQRMIEDQLNESIQVAGAELRVPSQASKLMQRMKVLFDDVSPDAQKSFLELLNKDPNKPFLLLHGHGDIVSYKKSFGRTDSKWMVGEMYGDNVEDIKEVLKLVNPDQYSAVLLISCNEKGVKLNVPYKNIFYAQEIVGGESKRKRPAIKT